MSRRTRPIERRVTAEFDAAGAAQLRAQVESIAYGHEELKQLPDQAWEGMLDALVDAIGFTKAGLADILAGKETKPAAWAMDILVRDVCDALRAVGAPVFMNKHREDSLAQTLVGELAALAGLPGQGELFKQMQRARKIEKAGGATCPGKPDFVLGQWQVLGRKAGVP
jgi:hypothetical protein